MNEWSKAIQILVVQAPFFLLELIYIFWLSTKWKNIFCCYHLFLFFFLQVNRRGSNGVDTCKPKLSTLRNPQLSPLQVISNWIISNPNKINFLIWFSELMCVSYWILQNLGMKKPCSSLTALTKDWCWAEQIIPKTLSFYIYYYYLLIMYPVSLFFMYVNFKVFIIIIHKKLICF